MVLAACHDRRRQSMRPPPHLERGAPSGVVAGEPGEHQSQAAFSVALLTEPPARDLGLYGCGVGRGRFRSCSIRTHGPVGTQRLGLTLPYMIKATAFFG